MSLRGFDDRRFFRLLCFVLAVVTATAPSASVFAQTNAAQQAVRRSVDNLGGAPLDTERNSGSDTAQPASYQRDVLPILRAHCHGCHGPRRTSGGLEMTTFDNLLRGGESGSPAIVPGRPDESYLIQQITPEGGRAAMPQRRPPLAGAQIALIRRWIEEGAVNDAATSAATDSRRDAYSDERGGSYAAAKRRHRHDLCCTQCSGFDRVAASTNTGGAHSRAVAEGGSHGCRHGIRRCRSCKC